MEYMRRFLSLLVFVLLFQNLNAVTVEIDGICYIIDITSGLAEVTNNPYNVYKDSIIIPEKFTYEEATYQVTSIGAQAFFCCDKVLSISFPQSICSIGNAAFWGCHAIDSIAIPELVSEIKDDLFADCQGLRRVVLPNGITRIGNSAFNGCVSLDSLVLPHTVELIDDWAFTGCKNLSYIEIPQKLSQVGRSAFADCPLVDVIISDLSSWCMIDFADRTANPLCYSHQLVVNGKEIVALEIPDSVTFIGKCAFTPCWNITSLTIGENIVSIGSWAFGECSNLTSVTCYPRKVPASGESIFSKSALDKSTLYVAESAASDYKNTTPWSGFKEIVCLDIPKYQLSYYVDDTLYKSYTLEEGEYITPEPSPVKDGYTFSGWSEIPVTMPNHDVTITGTFTLTSYQMMLDGISYTLWVKDQTAEVTGVDPEIISASLGCITIPKMVSKADKDYIVISIADSVFIGCSSMIAVTIPNTVNYIGKGAFNGCKLERVICRCPSVSPNDAFSLASYNHAVLYVPEGKRWEAIYDGGWYEFINIRETAMDVNDLSPNKAYTLMNAQTFAYSVYDAVNNKVKIIKDFHNVDASVANNSWQIVEKDGQKCLYNIGARKYAVMMSSGEWTLMDTPTPLNMESDEDGKIRINAQGVQWYFVLNEQTSVDYDVAAINAVANDGTVKRDYYTAEGKRIVSLSKGLNIVKYSDGSTKKVIKN